MKRDDVINNLFDNIEEAKLTPDEAIDVLTSCLIALMSTTEAYCVEMGPFIGILKEKITDDSDTTNNSNSGKEIIYN